MCPSQQHLHSQQEPQDPDPNTNSNEKPRGDENDLQLRQSVPVSVIWGQFVQLAAAATHLVLALEPEPDPKPGPRPLPCAIYAILGMSGKPARRSFSSSSVSAAQTIQHSTAQAEVGGPINVGWLYDDIILQRIWTRASRLSHGKKGTWTASDRHPKGNPVPLLATSLQHTAQNTPPEARRPNVEFFPLQAGN